MLGIAGSDFGEITGVFAVHSDLSPACFNTLFSRAADGVSKVRKSGKILPFPSFSLDELVWLLIQITRESKNTELSFAYLKKDGFP